MTLANGDQQALINFVIEYRQFIQLEGVLKMERIVHYGNLCINCIMSTTQDLTHWPLGDWIEILNIR